MFHEADINLQNDRPPCDHQARDASDVVGKSPDTGETRQ